MQRKIQARLASLPRTQASFIEPMECLSVSRLPEGVAVHLGGLMWGHIKFHRAIPAPRSGLGRAHSPLAR